MYSRVFLQLARSLLCWVLLTSGGTLVSLPWTLYSTFNIEQRHGFNNMTLRAFLWDQAKKFIVTLVLSTLFWGVLLQAMSYGGEYFFVYAWATVFAFSLGKTWFMRFSCLSHCSSHVCRVCRLYCASL
jgi:STE24 endopeptidase